MKRNQRTDPLLHLWQQAITGDTDATNELAKCVRPWIIKESHRYEVKYHNAIPADDFISIAYEKLLPAIRTYDPDRGSQFMGYFISIASRAMVELFKTYKHKHTQMQSAMPGLARDDETYDADPVHTRECAAVNTALQWISPFERELLEVTSGSRGQPRSIPSVARFLRISEVDAGKMFDRLTKRVARHVENRVSRGPAPDAVLAEIVDYAIDRRRIGESWAAIRDRVNAEYGRNYTKDTLRKLVHHKRRRQRK